MKTSEEQDSLDRKKDQDNKNLAMSVKETYKPIFNYYLKEKGLARYDAERRAIAQTATKLDRSVKTIQTLVGRL